MSSRLGFAFLCYWLILYHWSFHLNHLAKMTKKKPEGPWQKDGDLHKEELTSFSWTLGTLYKYRNQWVIQKNRNSFLVSVKLYLWLLQDPLSCKKYPSIHASAPDSTRCISFQFLICKFKTRSTDSKTTFNRLDPVCPACWNCNLHITFQKLKRSTVNRNRNRK